MLRSDFLRLIGSKADANDLIPVACLLQNGYGAAGYFNSQLNAELLETCVLVNARLVDLSLREPALGEADEDGVQEMIPGVTDFAGFIETVATRLSQPSDYQDDALLDASGRVGRSVPLTAIPYSQITVLYPVSQISRLMRRIEEDQNRIPTFLDFENHSIVVRVLKTKIW